MHRQCFFQPFLQAPRRARIDSFQLPEDFLQRLFGLRVVVHRIRVAHSSNRSLSGSSRAGTPSHSAACESGNAALPLVHRKHVPHRLAALSIHPAPPDTAAGDPALGPPDLPTALGPPWCSPWLLATLPTRAFLRLPRSPEPPPAPGRQSGCHRSSAPPDSDPPIGVRTAPATDCNWPPRTPGSRCSSRSRSLPQHSPPLADSSAWTVRPPCVPAPRVAAFRLAATDRSSPVPLPGPRGFVPAVVPAGSSVHRRPRNPTAFPSAHNPLWDLADVEVLLGA